MTYLLTKDPVSAAQNTIQPSGVTIPALTIKSVVGQTGETASTDESLLRLVDSGGTEWLRIRPPDQDPMPASPTAVNTGRIEFPNTGTGLAPLAIAGGRDLFTTTPDPIIAMGYNYQPGTGRIVTAQHSSAMVVEGKFWDGTNNLTEWYWQYFPPTSGSFERPIYAAVNIGGASKQARWQETVFKASGWNFVTAATDTEATVLKILDNGATITQYGTAAADAVLEMLPTTSREAKFRMGRNGANMFQIETGGSPNRVDFSFAGTYCCEFAGTYLKLFSGARFTVNDLWEVLSTGVPKWTAAGNQQTTVGAAGGASALPATPTKYLHVRDSAGTLLVVPCYAAA